jgi:tetratricopeptide (TPR) repeat protein
LAYVSFVRKTDLKAHDFIKLAVLYTVAIVFWIILRNMVPRSFETQSAISDYILEIIRNFPAILLYIGKVFFPFDLSIYPNLNDHSLIPGIIGIVVLSLLVVLLKVEWKMVLWGLTWFFVFLLPSLIGNIFHEHRAYCALIGLLLVFSQIQHVLKMNFENKFLSVAVILSIITLSTISFVYADDYKNRSTYSLLAYLKDPSVDDSYSALAGTFIDAGNDETAMKIVDQGIARNNNMKMVHRMRGDILARQRKFQEAETEYKKSLLIEPLHPYTYIFYGALCLQQGNEDKALQLWRESVSTNPDFIPGYYYLAYFYLQSKNDPDSAMVIALEIQSHGVKVMPELINAIEQHPKYHRSPR